MFLLRQSALVAVASSACCSCLLCPTEAAGVRYPLLDPRSGLAEGFGNPLLNQEVGPAGDATLRYIHPDARVGSSQEQEDFAGGGWPDHHAFAYHEQQQQEQLQREQLQEASFVGPCLQLGSGLLHFVALLERSDAATRAALLRFFCVAVSRLRHPYLGLALETQAQRRELMKRQTRGAKGERAIELSNLVARLHGLLAAASNTPLTESVMASSLLLPFTRLVRESEDLLFANARQGDPVAFIGAAKALGPRLRAGLAHLAGPFAAAGASGVVDPVRQSLLLRVKQLDVELDGAASNLEAVKGLYAEELSDEVLERERERAEREGRHRALGPPPALGVHDKAAVGKKRSTVVTILVFLCWMIFALAISTYVTSAVRRAEASFLANLEGGGRAREGRPPSAERGGPGFRRGPPNEPDPHPGYVGGFYGFQTAPPPYAPAAAPPPYGQRETDSAQTSEKRALSSVCLHACNACAVVRARRACIVHQKARLRVFLVIPYLPFRAAYFGPGLGPNLSKHALKIVLFPRREAPVYALLPHVLRIRWTPCVWPPARERGAANASGTALAILPPFASVLKSPAFFAQLHGYDCYYFTELS
ncbi:hypothetical protein Esti_005983 [Eimeria stiedai]